MAKSPKTMRGQALLEAVVALNIIIAAMLGIFVLLSNSIGHSRTSVNQSIAVNLAAEGIEVVKSIIDKNAIQDLPWNQGLTDCTAFLGGCDVQFNSDTLNTTWNNFPLKFDPLISGNPETAGTYNHDNGEDTIFHREIIVEPSPIETVVTSEVSWVDRGGASFSVILEDKFFNWR